MTFERAVDSKGQNEFCVLNKELFTDSNMLTPNRRPECSVAVDFKLKPAEELSGPPRRDRDEEIAPAFKNEGS